MLCMLEYSVFRVNIPNLRSRNSNRNVSLADISCLFKKVNIPLFELHVVICSSLRQFAVHYKFFSVSSIWRLKTIEDCEAVKRSSSVR